jgi:hypothetical protein
LGARNIQLGTQFFCVKWRPPVVKGQGCSITFSIGRETLYAGHVQTTNKIIFFDKIDRRIMPRWHAPITNSREGT